jgi:hypothetical protein
MNDDFVPYGGTDSVDFNELRARPGFSGFKTLRREATGEMFLVRYADDIIVGCELLSTTASRNVSPSCGDCER